MKLAFNFAKNFHRSGRVHSVSGIYRGHSCPRSIILLWKREEKSNFYNQIAQIRFLFTEDFLGTSIIPQKLLAAKKELEDQQIDPTEFRESITKRTTINTGHLNLKGKL